jgi:GTP cyclohydrolase I
MAADKRAAARAIEDFLRALGRDPAREPDLRGTGERVADAFADEFCEGYDVDVGALLAENVLPREATTPSLVIVRGIAVATTCPHHLMPALGTATVAFAPTRAIVGVGAVGRVVDAFARRLTLQERIGEEVTAALYRAIAPQWVACRLVLEHACMTARGERRHGARLETLAVEPGGEAVDLAAIRAAVGVGT